MLYTVTEISKLINLSKVTLYKKLKAPEMEQYITKKQNITYVTEEGLTLIKQGLQDLNGNEIHSAYNDEMATDTDYVNLLKENITNLKEQQSIKDQLIFELNERLKQEQELNKNSQILQLKQQPPDIKQLEEHFQDLDTKLQEVKENMIERKEQQNKGFFSKFFKK